MVRGEGFGFRVEGSGSRFIVRGFGFWVMVQGSGLGFRVRVQGQGSGLRLGFPDLHAHSVQLFVRFPPFVYFL